MATAKIEINVMDTEKVKHFIAETKLVIAENAMLREENVILSAKLSELEKYTTIRTVQYNEIVRKHKLAQERVRELENIQNDFAKYLMDTVPVSVLMQVIDESFATQGGEKH